MAETIVENKICSVCGTEVRKGALFCYHCGSAVAPDIIALKADKINDENQVVVKKDFTENGQKDKRKKLKDRPENELVSLEEIAENPILIPEVQPETTLKSAASLRKKAKVYQKKKVEIVWEEHENAPNVWFILAAFLLTVFAVAVMWLALYFG